MVRTPEIDDACHGAMASVFSTIICTGIAGTIRESTVQSTAKTMTNSLPEEDRLGLVVL